MKEACITSHNQQGHFAHFHAFIYTDYFNMHLVLRTHLVLCVRVDQL